jgi:deoxyribose-phosphate aldolase
MTEKLTPETLAPRIDHTLLNAHATTDQIKRLCREAGEYNFHSVCVTPRWVPLAADILHGQTPCVCTVVGFPLGADTPRIKIAATKDAIMAGADEIDMVADLAAIIENDTRYTATEIALVARACHSMRPPVTLKVIIEAPALTEQQKITVCRIASDCRADFVKTSTGLLPTGGATPEDVKLMAENAPNCKVKAAGGIRTPDDCLKMIHAGAERIGTSSAVDIINRLAQDKTPDV